MYITFPMYTLNSFDLLVALVLQLPGAFAGQSSPASRNPVQARGGGGGASAASPNRNQAKRQQEF
jgi:hypothetical protein